jgi:CheY-like chemotaxis protein
LGLAISRKYVQLLGADINVNSQLGQGTIFQFEIKVTPLVGATTKSQQQGLAITLLPNQPRYRILVVDDDESNRRLLVSILSPLEFEVKEATNGQEALELWETFHPHLVWLDMQMPMLDGYATTQQLKARSAGQATVIIALTASIEEQKTTLLAAGCDDIVCKPIQEQVIFGKISQHLGVRFLYKESTSVVDTDSDSALDLSALQSLPKLWVTELEQAALALDDELLYALVGQIQSQETALAKALLTYIKNFEYQKIVEAIATARIGDSVQQELSSSAVKSHLPSELKLSCEWVANMKHAIYRADLDIIESLIDHLQGENAPFAHSLQRYLDNFEYKKILTVIAEAEKHLSFAERSL